MKINRSVTMAAIVVAMTSLLSQPGFALDPEHEREWVLRLRAASQVHQEAIRRVTEAMNRKIACLNGLRMTETNPAVRRQIMDRSCPDTEIDAAKAQVGPAKAGVDAVHAGYYALQNEYVKRNPATASPDTPRETPSQQSQRTAPERKSPEARKREVVLSGNWAASCAEQGERIVCQRYGGFLSNTFPTGCEGNNLFVCRGRSLCSLAGEITIVETSNMRRLQAGLERCPNSVRRPPTT